MRHLVITCADGGRYDCPIEDDEQIELTDGKLLLGACHPAGTVLRKARGGGADAATGTQGREGDHMIPEWLIITVGVAIVLALTWPLILLAFAALCGIFVGLMDLIEAVGRKTGFYRWRHQRRIKTGYYRKRMDRKRGRR